MILIGMGANLPGPFGGPEESLQAAVAAMAGRGIHAVSVSRIWLTTPVPISDQPLYRNAVASVETVHDPFNLFHALKAIEKEFGRIDSSRNAPRILDLDILSYNQMSICTDELIIPHPRMHERGFVLYPLKEIAPDWVHASMGKTVDDFLALLPPGQRMETASAA